VSFWKTSSWIAGHLPAGPVYRVGSWISMVGYAASPTRRRWLRQNFGHVLNVPPDDKAAHKMARAAYLNYSSYLMELMRLPWLKKEQVDQLLEVGASTDSSRSTESPTASSWSPRISATTRRLRPVSPSTAW
jgi:lauroyl/myristoyl acyltransferase